MRREARRAAIGVACLCGAALFVGCGSEESKPGRFGSGGASGGSTSGTGASAGGQGGTASSGAGGAGGSSTSQEVCIDTSMTVGDLQLTEGDAEFNGHGPVVTTTVSLSADPTSVVVEACVVMKETVADWTTGEGCEQLTVNVLNAGLLGNTDFSAEYTDTDRDVDNVWSEADTYTPADNLVLGVQCVGDTSGDDICASMSGDCSMCLFALGCFRVTKP